MFPTMLCGRKKPRRTVLFTHAHPSSFLFDILLERDKMGHQSLYWSHPRKFGQGSRSCRVCSNRHGLIRKYGLNMCRQCFRQYANDIGFVKLD
ncbi:small ribosomal subunit protein uS14-like [Salvelinus alpinus]